jgi:flagellar hook-associated protein 1 FlgK
MLSIGKQALSTTEKNLEVTAHNIANANTEGYSRQRIIQEASTPLNDANGNYGSGVSIVRLERMRDLRLDTEFRNLNSNTGYWESMSSNLQELEKSVVETSEYGIGTMINNFFNKWEALANNPYSEVHRIDVIDATTQMTESFKGLNMAIEDTRDNLKFSLKDTANRINEISDELASLSNQISQNKINNKPANDYLDKFDLLIDELSQYGNVQVHERENGTMSVYFGTDELVRNDVSNKLIYTESTNLESNEEEAYLIWDNTKSKISGLTSGSLKSMYDLRDTVLPEYKTKLDDLAVQIAEKVNEIHIKGYDMTEPAASGRYFFNAEVTGVENFELSNEILSDPANIAVSGSGQIGDNQIALQITDLKYENVFDGKTITEAFADYVYEIGRDVKTAGQNAERTSMLSSQTDNFRESVKGVSMNEETANLMKFQQAYQAAAKIITIADDIMTTIIGLVK